MSAPSDILFATGDDAPNKPTAGKILFYPKSNGIFYSMRDDGVEIAIGGAGAGLGSVTSVNATGANGISISGAPIAGSGTLAFSLGDITPASVAAVGTVTGLNLVGTNTGDQTINLIGAVTGSGTGAIATTLSHTGVVAGNYTDVSISVGVDGRISAISSGTPVSVMSSDASISVSKASNSYDVTLPHVVAPGVYGDSNHTPVLTIDQFGRVVNAGIVLTAGGGATASEMVVFHYSAGDYGNFTAADVLHSKTLGVDVNITDPANCVATYSFSGKANPPKSITMYGQNYTSNTFSVTGWPATGAPGANFKIAGGGTASMPDLAAGLFTPANLLTLQTRMSDTGASSTMGFRAWLVIVFGF